MSSVLKVYLLKICKSIYLMLMKNPDLKHDIVGNRDYVNWLDLPDHLVSLIPKKFIHIKDFIRFGAVCRSWQSVYTDNRNSCLPPHPHQLPMLMLPTEGDKDGKQSRSFYDLSEERVYNSLLLVPHDQHCRGSSNGWLVNVSQKVTVHLLNPFHMISSSSSSLNNYNNQHIIELPPLTTIKHDQQQPDPISDEGYLQKAVLSTNPSSNPDGYTVLAIYGGWSRLAFYKPGNNAWTCIDFDRTLFDDIISDADGNHFYALDHRGIAWDIGDLSLPHPKLSKLSPPIENFERFYQKYLVQSSGQLLMVLKNLDGDDDKPITTLDFQVLKLDPVEFKWIATKDLGGHTLFLGKNASFSLLATDYPGCKPNCVYFTDDCAPSGGKAHDMGIYNLEDRSIKPHYPFSREHDRIFPHPIWIEPTPL